MGGALSFFGTSPVDAVTGDRWMGMSEIVERDSADVHEGSPRFVSLSLEVRAEGEVGVLAKGEGENKSYLIVEWSFVGLSDFEGSKVDESDVSGGCARVRAPTVIA